MALDGSRHGSATRGRKAVQVVYDGTIAWHAPPNPNSIGIEICDMPSTDRTRWDDDNHQRALEITADLTAQLCLAYDVPIRRVGPIGLKAGRKGICGHVDVSQAFGESSHWDPGAFRWKRFMTMVRARADQIRKEA